MKRSNCVILTVILGLMLPATVLLVGCNKEKGENQPMSASTSQGPPVRVNASEGAPLKSAAVIEDHPLLSLVEMLKSEADKIATETAPRADDSICPTRRGSPVAIATEGHGSSKTPSNEGEKP